MREKMKYQYDHFGVPVKKKQEGMIHFPEYKVWCSDYEKDLYRIEFIFFEKDCKLHPLIQNTSHVCFLVKDIQKAVHGKNILLNPIYYENYYMAFIEENGIAIEFLQYAEADV